MLCFSSGFLYIYYSLSKNMRYIHKILYPENPRLIANQSTFDVYIINVLYAVKYFVIIIIVYKHDEHHIAYNYGSRESCTRQISRNIACTYNKMLFIMDETSFYYKSTMYIIMSMYITLIIILKVMCAISYFSNVIIKYSE